MVFKDKFFNIANTITLCRIAAIPVLIVLLYFSEKTICLISSLVFTLASITDLLDGYIARKFNIVTSLGKFLDPLADKLLVTVAMIMLISHGRVPAWMAAVIIGREIAVTGLRGIAVGEGIIIEANQLGKYKTTFQLLALIALIIHYDYFSINFHYIGIIFLWIALIITTFSGLDYFIKFFRKIF
ncbi:MAG: CDP-diacylglycerol--glycerol-3-phosphate 3-phosphatidyltransferase [Thermodesulfobacteriota bacterium]|nr:CDP-diacylglycerol--glycerol-3-phosphate 3-phosphatidyltransferase [Thermodesulfobacteriota bacterium]